MIRVQYLVILSSKDEYLKKETDFKYILQVINGVEDINNNSVKYKGIKINYEIKYINEEKGIIKCQFSINKDDSIEQFQEFLRIFRVIFTKLAGIDAIDTLWDDVGFYYAKLAYPKIHIIENKMRSLITQFMYVNVGRNWSMKYVPNEVKLSIRGRENKKELVNFLNKIDFIKLIDFLFNEYSYKDTNQMIEFIKSNKNKAISYKQLDEYIPVSNWDRFFKSKLNIESKELEKKWNTLYELRCIVAHNNNISKEQFDLIEKLSDEIGTKIDEAIDSLENIKIKEIDRVNILDQINKDNIEKDEYESKCNEEVGIYSSEGYDKKSKVNPIDKICPHISNKLENSVKMNN